MVPPRKVVGGADLSAALEIIRSEYPTVTDFEREFPSLCFALATGVGKTTTIAKLAAHFALMQGKRVGLITVDTYRIAAVDQLKTYSQIIGLPVNVAYSPAELPPILDQYADYDLVLIDTAGRSQQHAGHQCTSRRAGKDCPSLP